MIVIAERTEIVGYINITLRNDFNRQIARTDEHIEQKTYSCCTDSGEESIGDGVKEDTTSVLLCAERS